jgi:uncharacterized protein
MGLHSQSATATLPAVASRDPQRIAEQFGRRPLPFTRVVARCCAGWPVAVEQPPFTPSAAPFPTMFWLTCPGLVRAIHAIESDGGVQELEQRIAGSRPLRRQLAQARRRQRQLRPQLGDSGIGGTRHPDTVKCLHAHAAFALGAPDYPIGSSIIDAAGGLPEPCCMERGA